MKCKNCGNQLTDNEIFCSVCGTKTDTSETQNTNSQTDNNTTTDYNNAGSESSYNSASDNGFTPTPDGGFTSASGSNFNEVPQEPVKTKKKAPKIIGIVCGVVVVALGATGITLAATGQLTNFCKKNFSSPENYLKYVVSKNAENNIETFNNSYSKVYENIDAEQMSGKVKLDVAVGDSLKPLIGLLSQDLTNLNNASLEINSSIKGDVQNVEVTANVNDKKVATLKSTLNSKKETGYIQIPELSKSYLDYSEGVAELNEEMSSYGANMSSTINELKENLPTPDALTEIITTYSDIAINNISDVDKSSKTIEAEGIKQKCTALTATIDGDYSYDVALEVLETLADDKNIEDIISSMDEDTYDDFSSEIEDAITELKDNKSSIKDEFENDMELTFYVNSKGEIVGEAVYIEVDDEEINISCVMPQKGSKFGYLLSAEIDDSELLSLTGKGTLKNDVMNGKFDLTINEEYLEDVSEYVSSSESIINIEVIDYNMKASKEGNFKGTFKLSSDAITMVSGYEAVLDITSDDKEATIAVTICSGSDEWATITLTSGEGNTIKELKPSDDDSIYSVTDEEDITAYAETIDIDSFAKQLSDATGIDITTEDIQTFLENIFASSNDYDDDYYYEDEDYDYSYDEDDDEYDFSFDDTEDEYDYSYDDTEGEYDYFEDEYDFSY